MSERRFRFVQHISGQGKSWPLQEVSLNNPAALPMWFVYDPESDGQPFTFPKSEYRLVEPPERWVDVTKDCEFNEYGTLIYPPGHTMLMIGFNANHGFRLRKVELFDRPSPGFDKARSVFLIEKKEFI